MLPEAFLKRMEHQLGEEYPAFLAALERPRAVALRFNPLKGEAPHMDFTGDPVPWEPRGYYYDPNARPGLHPYHEAGVYYLQEASAMAPVSLLDPQPGEWVCDLCAAPGGKTTQIAGRMAGKGFLLCNEINPKRAKILSRNIERMGVGNALVTNEHPGKLAERFAGCFDKVLIDAPCSGEGMFRKEEAAVTDWSQETVEMCARRQQEILASGAMLVRPGGRLVYSTCTFAPEENEQAVAAFLEKHPDFTMEKAEAPWFTPAGEGAFRLLPHKLLGEGHFAAVLHRQGDAQREEPTPAPAEKLPKEWTDFAKDLEIQLPAGQALTFGQSIYWAPEGMPQLRGLKVERPGLELGVAKKGRFEPAHALALWLRGCARQQDFAADSPEIAAYMHGDVVSAKEKGWCLVTVDGYSIGWGKGAENVLKNHYPKGLRR
ncbi:MAG: RsmB/NOP family class I SAM-dependent RNA methyltransferase [Oscillospiraceae bacterium]|nr:RsmB/NOP family class I SAM-dependent RNA methyltransferase [Oscillospiraceae bacterium]MBQ9842807.1 RsmB/NOP family class I SAM-dependent RNA methyltransferase [Oscillospiraceae bacterium]